MEPMSKQDIRRKRIQRERQRRRSLLRFFVIAVIVFAFILFIFNTKLFGLKHINVSGNKNLSTDDIIKAVSYTHLTLPTKLEWCRSRWSPYH